MLLSAMPWQASKRRRAARLPKVQQRDGAVVLHEEVAGVGVRVEQAAHQHGLPQRMQQLAQRALGGGGQLRLRAARDALQNGGEGQACGRARGYEGMKTTRRSLYHLATTASQKAKPLKAEQRINELKHTTTLGKTHPPCAAARSCRYRRGSPRCAARALGCPAARQPPGAAEWLPSCGTRA